MRLVPASRRFILLVWFLSSLLARSASATPAPTIFFRHVRVFDGTRSLHRGCPRHRRKDRGARSQAARAADAEIVDGAGKTLLPGLIDAHIHVWTTLSCSRPLVFGVTTELDMFDRAESAARCAREQAAASDRAADLRSAGFAATAPGGHGTEYGFDVADADHAASRRRRSSTRGSPRARTTSRSSTTTAASTASTSRRSTSRPSRRSIAAAHRRGKLAVVHIATQADARDAIGAGVDGLAHMFVDTPPGRGLRVVRPRAPRVRGADAVGQRARERHAGRRRARRRSGARAVPVARGLARLRETFPHNPGSRAEYAYAAAAVKPLAAAGVPLLAGTDAPNAGTTYGASLHGELALLVDAGLTPAQALTAATSAPATAFHLADRGRDPRRCPRRSAARRRRSDARHSPDARYRRHLEARRARRPRGVSARRRG